MATMPYVVLSGFMATGKSTLGPMLAERLGVPFVDTDDIVATEAGESVPALWKRLGEAGFRELEARVLGGLLVSKTARVIAVGGGTLTQKRLRHLALERAFVVTLEASPEAIVRRAGDLSHRPNLQAADPVARARHLLEQRSVAYAECHLRIQTDQLTPEQAVDTIVRGLSRPGVAVPLGERSYVVDFVRDDPSALTDAIAALDPSSVVVVTDANVEAARSAGWRAAVAPLGRRVVHVILPPGEEHKDLGTVASIWDAALKQGIDRRTVVVGFGGGVVGDLAGFAASTLLRGLRCVQSPTTLLSMVDASVGGKTGFDHAAGKNLIGTFHQPSRVVIDMAHLSTLPPRECRAGLAEVLKMALLEGGPFLDAFEQHADALGHENVASTTRGLELLEGFARAAVVGKMRLVRDDEREAGPRALLNLGHTVGHALEAHGGYARYLHGEAVGLGMVVELEAAERAGITRAGTAERTRRLLARCGLPSEVSPDEVRAAWSYVGSDKKKVGGELQWPIVAAPGAPEVRRVKLDELRGWVLGA